VAFLTTPLPGPPRVSVASPAELEQWFGQFDDAA
jgi:hypothetical protein